MIEQSQRPHCSARSRSKRARRDPACVAARPRAHTTRTFADSGEEKCRKKVTISVVSRLHETARTAGGGRCTRTVTWDLQRRCCPLFLHGWLLSTGPRKDSRPKYHVIGARYHARTLYTFFKSLSSGLHVCTFHSPYVPEVPVLRLSPTLVHSWHCFLR